MTFNLTTLYTHKGQAKNTCSSHQVRVKPENYPEGPWVHREWVTRHLTLAFGDRTHHSTRMAKKTSMAILNFYWLHNHTQYLPFVQSLASYTGLEGKSFHVISVSPLHSVAMAWFVRKQVYYIRCRTTATKVIVSMSKDQTTQGANEGFGTVCGTLGIHGAHLSSTWDVLWSETVNPVWLFSVRISEPRRHWSISLVFTSPIF